MARYHSSRRVLGVARRRRNRWPSGPNARRSMRGDYYFPKGALDPSRSKIDGLTRDWYSQFLRAMLEPSLSCGQGSDGFAYRFLWLRSAHHPIAVRVEGSGSSLTLSAVELDGTGGHAPGEIVKRVQRALSPAEREQVPGETEPRRVLGNAEEPGSFRSGRRAMDPGGRRRRSVPGGGTMVAGTGGLSRLVPSPDRIHRHLRSRRWITIDRFLGRMCLCRTCLLSCC